MNKLRNISTSEGRAKAFKKSPATYSFDKPSAPYDFVYLGLTPSIQQLVRKLHTLFVPLDPASELNNILQRLDDIGDIRASCLEAAVDEHTRLYVDKGRADTQIVRELIYSKLALLLLFSFLLTDRIPSMCRCNRRVGQCG